MKIEIGILRAAFVVVGCILCGCNCLKDVRIKVPMAVERGHDAVLECRFDLDGDRLYSVKWYRGGWEFYRYTPSESPPIKQFKIKGLNVREEDSKDTQVVLANVSRDVGGMFSCEVTADQPSFFTDMQTAELQVVDLPRQDPYITGLKPRYRPGEMLKANCTSEGSNPAANLTWYVNGRPVDPKHVHKHRPRLSSISNDYDYNLLTIHSTLRIYVTKDHFKSGHVKIRCMASLYHLYHRSYEKSVELEKRRHRPAYIPPPTTSTTMVPYRSWELTQAAKRPPDTTWVFLSPVAEQTSSGKQSNLAINFLLAIILNAILLQR